MKTRRLFTRVLCAAALLAAVASPSFATPRGYGYTASGQLFSFDLNRPEGAVAIGSPVANIKALATQPGTSTLWALQVGALNTQLYTVSLTTGVLTPVGGPILNTGTAGGTPYTIDPTADYGLAFNPNTVQVDGSIRIRLVGSTGGLDLRLNSQTGLVSNVDGTLAYSGGVPATLSVTGVAYTNSDAARLATPPPATATTIFYLDATNNNLATSAAPNGGVLTPVGALGIDFNPATGFDIFAGNSQNAAYATLQLASGTTFSLYTVNLTTGAASPSVGNFLAPLEPAAFAIVDVPLPPLPAATYGFSYNAAGQLFYFPINNPAAAAPLGSPVGPAVKALSFLPGTTALYAIDVSATTAQLYTVNLQTGVRTPVGAGFPTTGTLPGNYTLSATAAYGFDFNPTTLSNVDGSTRIRLVNTDGQNLRLNSLTGQIAAVDTTLTYVGGTPATSAISAVAYTNTNNVRVAGTGALTQLYYLDTANDNLTTSASPNGGQFTIVGALGVNAATPSELDILTNDSINYGFTILNVGGTYSLAPVDLVTGLPGTAIGVFPAGFQPVGGLAVRVIPGFPNTTDIIAPKARIIRPTRRNTRTTATAYLVRGTASDDAIVTRVQVRLRSLNWRTVSGTTSWDRRVNLSRGKNLVSVRAFDSSGNVSDIQRAFLIRR